MYYLSIYSVQEELAIQLVEKRKREEGTLLHTELTIFVYGWMEGWMDGRMDGWMDGWKEGWTDGWMDVMYVCMYV